jgi:hypothetical protein
MVEANMEYHYTLIEDATHNFRTAFSIYERLRDSLGDLSTSGNTSMRSLADCGRALYVAFEKGFKHVLVSIDPHLIISKYDRKLLLNIWREQRARPKPNILCLGTTFETLNMLEAWELVSDLLKASIPDAISSQFSSTLPLLAQIRNRAQHGEIWADPEDVYALFERIFASSHELIVHISSEWLQRLCSEYDNLESRLRAVRDKVDAAWQILLDHVSSVGVLRVNIGGWIIHESSSGLARLLIGGERPGDSVYFSLVGENVDASGLFAQPLTEEQCRARREERSIHADNFENDANRYGLAALTQSANIQHPVADRPIAPLVAGRIVCRAALGTLCIIASRRSYVSIRAMEWAIAFSDPLRPEGTISGLLESAKAMATDATCLEMIGQATLISEFGIVSSAERATSLAPGTGWQFVGEATIRLRSDRVPASTTVHDQETA